MVIRRALIAIVAVAGLAAAASWSPPAGAAPCAGFLDLDDSSSFCANVQWIRNRGVTLGCSIPNAYCPGDPVIRASMALFLQRLGLALTPEYLQGAQGVNEPVDPAPVRCVVTPNIVNWPRVVEGIGSFVTLSNPGAADYAVQFVETLDAGKTWTAVSPMHAMSVTDQGSGTAVVLLPPRLLAAATQYQYGLRISRVAGSTTTGNPSSGTCRSRLSVSNRNPGSPPFDE
jgi:hypothetical protein